MWDSGPGADGAVAIGDIAVIADPGSTEEIVRAVAVAGAGVAGCVGWAAIDDLSFAPVLVVEARGIADAVLVAGLPGVAERMADGARVVVAMELGQIDLVAVRLLAPAAELLCEPTMAELVAAVAFARGSDEGQAYRGVREDDGERLARLHGEIARIADMLGRLVSQDRSTARAPVRDRRPGFGGEPGAPEVDPAEIRRVIRARRLRDEFVGRDVGERLFADPAWDMLLDLLAAELEDIPVSVSSLCIAAAVAQTTALRWVGKLAGIGLIERRPDPNDGRRAFVALSVAARDGLSRYLMALSQAGLPLV